MTKLCHFNVLLPAVYITKFFQNLTHEGLENATKDSFIHLVVGYIMQLTVPGEKLLLLLLVTSNYSSTSSSSTTTGASHASHFGDCCPSAYSTVLYLTKRCIILHYRPMGSNRLSDQHARHLRHYYSSLSGLQADLRIGDFFNVRMCVCGNVIH